MKTQKIVLALALAAVTPAVLVAQENGNAYNKSSNEVIAPKPQTQQASIAHFGPEGKILSLADLSLAKIRQNREERQARKQQQKQEAAKQKPVNKTDTTPAYYVYAGREGHMMALENLGKKPKNNKKETKAQKPVNNNKTSRATSTYNPYVGPEGHRMATGNAVRDARRDSTPVPTHVKDIDTVAKNHQVTLDSKQSDKSAKKTNSTFRQYLREISQAIAQEARYSK